MIRIVLCVLIIIDLTLSLVLLDIDKCNAYVQSPPSTTVQLAKQQIDDKNDDNILLKRLSNKALDAVSYRPGRLSTDVYYPKWFNDKQPYKTSSRFTEVYSPLGIAINYLTILINHY